MEKQVNNNISPPSTQKQRISALILCAGCGARSGLLYNKLFYMLGKKTVLERTLDAFSKSLVSDITLVISPADEKRVLDIVDDKYHVSLCYGGSTRAESVKNGLNSLKNCDIVLIHDGARPNVTCELIDRCAQSAIEFGSGIAAVRAVDTLKTVADGFIQANIERSSTFHMQTPQAFSFDKILTAYSNMPSINATDDSEVYLQAGYQPKIVEGDYNNIKITSNNDLFTLFDSNLKIGTGFDVHQTTKDRPLILGGINIPHYLGLLGHSDADVLTHAIMDALLSAAGLFDIGVLFPDSAAEFKGISSIKLLRVVRDKISACGFIIRNISAVILAEKPKLAPFIPSIKQNLANELNINLNNINISATTTETLGLIGKEKGIAASAVCLLES